MCIDKVFWARFKEWTDKLPPADRPWLQATKESVKKDLAPTGIELLCTNEGEYLPFFEWTATAQAADELSDHFTDRAFESDAALDALGNVF